MLQVRYGSLDVRVAPSGEALGAHAAEDFAAALRAELASAAEVSVILATGNSQLSFIWAMADQPGVDWSRVNVLHMDEYYGMPETHPASFRRWMREHVVERVNPKAFYGMRGDHEPIEDEITRYERLLADLDPAICVMGIGENGHLAFNDPPASFDTDRWVHRVELDAACRTQQVGEGHFASLDETPTRALTLTIPALLRPRTVLVVTPEERKQTAVKRALEGAVSEDCPASILTTVGHARLYLDEGSAAGLRMLRA